MYIDSKKFDYSKFSYHDSDKLIKRDKDFLKEAYVKWIHEIGDTDNLITLSPLSVSY